MRVSMHRSLTTAHCTRCPHGPHTAQANSRLAFAACNVCVRVRVRVRVSVSVRACVCVSVCVCLCDAKCRTAAAVAVGGDRLRLTSSLAVRHRHHRRQHRRRCWSVCPFARRVKPQRTTWQCCSGAPAKITPHTQTHTRARAQRDDVSKVNSSDSLQKAHTHARTDNTHAPQTSPSEPAVSTRRS